MKFLVKDFFIKCDQISSFLRIWSHLLKKSLIENFIFCAVITRTYLSLLFHTHTHTRARTHTRLCVKIPENFFSLLFHGKISFHFSCNLFQVCHPNETTCTDPANHTQQKHRSCIYNFFCDFFLCKKPKKPAIRLEKSIFACNFLSLFLIETKVFAFGFTNYLIFHFELFMYNIDLSSEDSRTRN